MKRKMVKNRCPVCKRKVTVAPNSGRRQLTHSRKCELFWADEYDRRERILHFADGPKRLGNYFR